MRCLSYRVIKIHRKFTSAYLLCDKASLRAQRCIEVRYIEVSLVSKIDCLLIHGPRFLFSIVLISEGTESLCSKRLSAESFTC